MIMKVVPTLTLGRLTDLVGVVAMEMAEVVFRMGKEVVVVTVEKGMALHKILVAVVGKSH